MKEIEVFTDGACRGNPGDGGWGVLLIIDGEETTLFGGEQDTTNNRMELKAAIKALEFFDDNVSLSITTDSNYVKDGITKWMTNWKKKNWITASRKPVKNKDLWLELYNLNQSLNIEWNWVKAHAGNPLNEEVDLLAKKAAQLD